MQQTPSNSSIEPRWPIALTIIAVLVLLSVLPDHIRIFPIWVHYLLGMIILITLVAVPLSRGKRQWLRAERVATWLFCGVIGVGTLVSLALLIEEMITGTKGISGLYLLTSSIGVWVTNVLVFSLLYWQCDRGGPEARLRKPDSDTPDWLFPQTGLPEGMMANWQPTFVDYLFLGFTTATAFSPTDTLPLTARAKLLMMAESTIALVTIAAVASRAINILGS